MANTIHLCKTLILAPNSRTTNAVESIVHSLCNRTSSVHLLSWPVGHPPIMGHQMQSVLR